MNAKEKLNAINLKIDVLLDKIADADAKAAWFPGDNALDDERKDEWARDARELRVDLDVLMARRRALQDEIALDALLAVDPAAGSAFHTLVEYERVSDRMYGDLSLQVSHIIHAREDGLDNAGKVAKIVALLDAHKEEPA